MSGSSVTLTLYLHKNSATGAVIADVLISGQDGAGSFFDETTNLNGMVTITGEPGNWSFTASRSCFVTHTWSESIAATGIKDAFLFEDNNLFGLLPAIYRIRDAEKGSPLRSLLSIIEEQKEAVKKDIEGLYEDWFIETAADWVVSYIGDMVGNKPLHEIKQLRRTDVAKTIYYRRRKGTAAMLEDRKSVV